LTEIPVCLMLILLYSFDWYLIVGTPKKYIFNILVFQKVGIPLKTF